MDEQLEPMDAFFVTRLEGYEEHMLTNPVGVAEGYIELAKHLPSQLETLLDLGCGTGLELDEVFKAHPNARVTAIDLTQEMLDVMLNKYVDKHIDAIYHFDTPLTIENTLKLLKQAGFASSTMVWRQGATTIVVAEKPE